MKTTAIALLLLLQLTAYSQRTVQANAATLSFLEQFRQNYAAALQNGQPDKMSIHFADSIRLMPELQFTVWTKANVQSYYKALLSRFKVMQHVSAPLEVMDLGTRVVEFGTYTETLQQKTNGKTDTIRGKYANVWRKDDKGALTLLSRAWNYSHQVGIANRLIFPEVPALNMAYQPHIPVNGPLSFELAAYNGYQEKIITEHNPHLWGQFYTDDFLFLYSNHPPYKGRKEIDAFLADHVKHLPVFEKLDIRTDQVEDLDGYVIEYASHIAIVRAGNWSGVATGKNIYIWRREKSGALRICRGIAMYDRMQ